MQEVDFEFQYVQDKANGAADALSRKETNQIQPTWESLRKDKWNVNLPLLTISTVQYDTHNDFPINDGISPRLSVCEQYI
jgi:hypothetical protein